MPGDSPTSNERFRALWAVGQNESTSLVCEADEPHVEGSLRPERLSIGGVVAGEIFTVSNADVALRPHDQDVQIALGALEHLAK